jgi:hypothetical protein
LVQEEFKLPYLRQEKSENEKQNENEYGSEALSLKLPANLCNLWLEKKNENEKQNENEYGSEALSLKLPANLCNLWLEKKNENEKQNENEEKRADLFGRLSI